MGSLYNRVPKVGPKPGDHIYAWKTAYVHANHGIFVGDNTVIHFTPAGTGTVPPVVCPHYRDGDGDGDGVLSSCLDCFLSGGVLYRIEYAILPDFGDNMYSLAPADPPEEVVHRAKYLLENGSVCYKVFKSNPEDFAIYCKTSYVVLHIPPVGPNWLRGPINVGGPLAASFLRVTADAYGMVATFAPMVDRIRFADGWRRDLMKFTAEELTRRFAAGRMQVVESRITAPAPPPFQR